MHKMNNCNTTLANVIDGVSGPDSITSHWKQLFDKLLNVHVHVNSDNSLKDDILSNFDKIKHNSNMSVSTKSVSKIIGKLECGKSAGPDGIGAEYLKFSNIKIHVLLSLCFTLCLAHGYLPPAMIETTIVPIVKNKYGNLSDSSNYRPIALATILSKMFESVLLFKCAEYLSTSEERPQDLGGGGGQEFFFRFENLHVARLGGFGGMLPGENYLKRCNLVRFRVYFDPILSLFFSKNTIFYIKNKYFRYTFVMRYFS